MFLDILLHVICNQIKHLLYSLNPYRMQFVALKSAFDTQIELNIYTLLHNYFYCL